MCDVGPPAAYFYFYSMPDLNRRVCFGFFLKLRRKKYNSSFTMDFAVLCFWKTKAFLRIINNGNMDCCSLDKAWDFTAMFDIWTIYNTTHEVIRIFCKQLTAFVCMFI